MHTEVENRRIVIDTNVFISAIIGKYSYPYKIFNDLIATGEYQICMSYELFYEYKSVCKRSKFDKFQDFSIRADELLVTLKEIALFFNPKFRINVIKDDFDNRLLELAVESGANCIVTGNSNDFDFKEYKGIRILSPKELYETAVES